MKKIILFTGLFLSVLNGSHDPFNATTNQTAIDVGTEPHGIVGQQVAVEVGPGPTFVSGEPLAIFIGPGPDSAPTA